MEEEEQRTKDGTVSCSLSSSIATVFLQYLTPPAVYQYNNGEDDVDMA